MPKVAQMLHNMYQAMDDYGLAAYQSQIFTSLE